MFLIRVLDYILQLTCNYNLAVSLAAVKGKTPSGATRERALR